MSTRVDRYIALLGAETDMARDGELGTVAQKRLVDEMAALARAMTPGEASELRKRLPEAAAEG